MAAFGVTLALTEVGGGGGGGVFVWKRKKSERRFKKPVKDDWF